MRTEMVQTLTNNFEDHVQQTEGGVECWLVRDLHLLEHGRWDNFLNVISKAKPCVKYRVMMRPTILPTSAKWSIEAEKPRDAKGWVGSHMEASRYRKTLDQPAFAAKIDFYQALANSRSFRKLCKEWLQHVQ